MNGRIKELARLAQGKNPADYEPNDDVIIIATSDVEKFAELIVRECASMARVFHSHGYDFTGDLDLDEFMLKHFGVEE